MPPPSDPSPTVSTGLLAGLRAVPDASRYWVAYSGGLDSTVLLHAARALLGERVAALHVHHGLQAAADQWAERCRATAAAWGIDCRVREVDARAAPGESPEAAARRARYAALRAAVGHGECVLLAHHQEDQAETVLLQLLRGGGARGLAAMPAEAPFGAGRLARPWLGQPRAALEAYAAEHALSWIDDPSNRDLRYDRNYLRHEIMPRLGARWPAAAASLARSARHAAQAAELADALAAIDLATVAEGAALRIPALQALTPARRDNALRHWLRTRGLALPDPVHLARVVNEVLGAAPDRAPYVHWGQVEVRRFRDRLYATPSLPPHQPTWRVAWDLRAPLELPGGGRLTVQTVRGAGLRVGALEAGVTVGFRRGGEACALPGRAGTRPVKKLLQEAGLPPWVRERLPLVWVDERLAQVGDRWRCAPWAVADGEPGLEIRWEAPPALRPFLPAD
ncbi:tRNA lysidine(34) synthetase TilS [Ectothiorhodospiraceae bacterium 2226]|nr:tRNA lysidine(34) synthetase TilS [Ectothiorhodospiraceae bacterium 2226]